MDVGLPMYQLLDCLQVETWEKIKPSYEECYFAICLPKNQPNSTRQDGHKQQ